MGDLALQDCELLAQGQVLKDEAVAAQEQGAEQDAEEGREGHGGRVAAKVRPAGGGAEPRLCGGRDGR
jgi:hypothetical protein